MNRTTLLIGTVAAGAVLLFWWISVPVPVADSAYWQPIPDQQVLREDNPVASAFENLPAVPRPAVSMETLSDLRKSLQSMPKDMALKWIGGFLDSGRDKATGLSFVPAGDGSLTEWPSFRTFLIDSLYAIDPAAAATISRDILTTRTTPDEWALALRNIGRFDCSDAVKTLIRSKAEELISDPAWQENPTAGYLNAFDILVFTESVDSAPLLSALVQRKDRRELSHAGFLALDRLVQRKPEAFLQVIANDSSLREARPEMVAQQIARADLRASVQLEIMKTWLLDPSRTTTELDAFVAVYPNENRFSSNNLLSKEIMRTGAEIAEHDKAALQTIRTWLTDPAFSPVKEQLGRIERRLGSFTGGK